MNTRLDDPYALLPDELKSGNTYADERADESTVTPPDGDADESIPPGAARLTLIQAIQPERLSKRFDLAADGTLRKTPGGHLSEGTATVVQVATAADLAARLSTLTPAQALIHGIPTAGATTARVVASYALAKQQHQHPQETVIARTRQYFEFPHGPAVMMLDYDPPPNGAALDRDALLHALYQACPALEHTAHVWIPSASSYIARTDTGAWVRELAGQRVYALVADGTDIPRAGAALAGRLWLAGRGYIHVSKSGALLPRTLVDEAVWQPERLDFAGGASCGEGLEQRRGAPVIRGDAQYLDTATALAADPGLDIAARQIMEKAKSAKAVKSTQAVSRERWISTLVDRERRAGRCRDEAAEVELREGLKRAATRRHLPLDFRLTLENGDSVSVAEVLAAPDTYDGRRCRDPLEPDYGNDPRIALISLKAKQPLIYSHAHGGIRYTLETPPRDPGATPPPPQDPPRAATAYTPPDPGRPATGWPRINLAALKAFGLTTDLANAHRLLRYVGADWLFARGHGWHYWTGQYWQAGEERVRVAGQDLAQLICREAQALAAAAAADPALRDKNARQAAELMDWVVRAERRGCMDAALDLARDHLVIESRELDADGMALCCPNGTLDLRDGTLRPSRREDFGTRMTPAPFDPAATCPTFLAFLDTILAGDAAMIHFLQTALGYSLTASTAEQCFFIAYGSGQNGKSTLLNLFQYLLGDYARSIKPDLLLLRRQAGGGDYELAGLKARRMAIAIETDSGQRLNEARIKSMTGGEHIKARHIYQDFIEFEATHKIWLATNHKPEIRGTDLAIWRRVHLLPFTVTIPEEQKDPHLPDKLRAEASGILNWALEGCLRWQRDGLKAPERVTAATAEYRKESDVLGEFLEECCVMERRYTVAKAALYKAYTEWADTNGLAAENQRQFSARLQERGLSSAQQGHAKTHVWRGIGLKTDAYEGDPRVIYGKFQEPARDEPAPGVDPYEETV